ncbi:uncharacterized protein LTR77_010569 [Saxophila tyrrhenica]|uniref:F-box domain-containing protein n=1 Tax=Saxophila tyrrhenica TaxID=1690608 RepID=A0AAV9NV33_9PEZI|nr:hypothetical protein LTR77_010569 [Saxophila tyrrhenica]
MATARALNTPELLEDILLHLPLRDLLLSQRVSRTFHDVAAGSARIQKALFLQPASGETVYWDPTSPLVSDGCFRLESTDAETVVIANPFLAQFVRPRGLKRWMRLLTRSFMRGANKKTTHVSELDCCCSSQLDAMVEASLRLPHFKCNHSPSWQRMILADVYFEEAVYHRAPNQLHGSFELLEPNELVLGALQFCLELDGRACTEWLPIDILVPGRIARPPEGIDDTTGWTMLRLLESGGGKMSVFQDIEDRMDKREHRKFKKRAQPLLAVYLFLMCVMLAARAIWPHWLCLPIAAFWELSKEDWVIKGQRRQWRLLLEHLCLGMIAAIVSLVASELEVVSVPA